MQMKFIWETEISKKDMEEGVRLVLYTGLSYLFHTWPQKSSDMMKLVSVLFQAIGISSQTSLRYRAV